MITVHHLNNSRSQRILWLLEELELPYTVERYQRDPQTQLAPPELKRIHPLGKSPVVVDGDRTLIESGAIIESLVERHGKGRLAPAAGSANRDAYLQWLHFAEGSAMLPLLLKIYVGRLGDGGKPLAPRIESEMANYLGYIDTTLADRPWLLGEDFSAADIQLSFVGEAASGRTDRSRYPALEAWVHRFQQRPAYRRALEKGGPYAYGPKDGAASGG